MRVDELESALLEERPELDQDFARRLDEWADAGFPRDRGLGPRAFGARGGGLAAGFERAWEKMRATPPRRLLVPVGAAATFLVVVGLSVSQLNDPDGGLNGSSGDDAGSALGQADSVGDDSASSAIREAGGASTGSSAGAAADEVESAPPATQGAAPYEMGVPEETIEPAPIPGDGGGGVAPATDERLVDATARLTLGAEAEDVQGVANEVVEVTDRYDGVVLDSQVTSDEGGARAAFTLEIPFSELDAALTDLSELGDVISRTEAGEDITQGAVRSQKQLANVLQDLSKARIELELAETRRERLILKSQIASLEASADALRADVGQTQRQARFATVNVDITSNGSASDNDGWSLSDALDDAGRVLEVIGGIALIALAVLLPLALIGTLVYLVTAGTRRRNRERTLDEG